MGGFKIGSLALRKLGLAATRFERLRLGAPGCPVPQESRGVVACRAGSSSAWALRAAAARGGRPAATAGRWAPVLPRMRRAVRGICR